MTCSEIKQALAQAKAELLTATLLGNFTRCLEIQFAISLLKDDLINLLEAGR